METGIDAQGNGKDKGAGNPSEYPMEMHGVMAEYEKNGRFVRLLSVIKRNGAFEILDEHLQSMCGRHVSMRAAINASLDDRPTMGVRGAG
jgi:hypothetical protein